MSVDLNELYVQLINSINEIDEVLDSQEDASAIGKRKITNEHIENTKDSWSPVAERLTEQLNEAPVEVQIGFYYGLIRALNNSFGKVLADKLEEIVKSQPTPEVTKLPDEELTKLSETRSELYKKVKSLIEMSKAFGMEGSMEMPKRRTGKKGKRGPREISFFSFKIGDKTFDKLKDVAELYSGTYEKTSDLTKAMREAKINLTQPEDRFEFTLPDGEVLIGYRDADKKVDETTDDSDTDTEETSEEE